MFRRLLAGRPMTAVTVAVHQQAAGTVADPTTGRTRDVMEPDEIDEYEAQLELSLYREYRDIVRTFRYVVETERRFYLTNEVDVQPHTDDGDTWFELRLGDAWVWDMYRPARFIKNVRVLTFRDVNVEELAHDDHEFPPFMEG